MGTDGNVAVLNVLIPASETFGLTKFTASQLLPLELPPLVKLTAVCRGGDSILHRAGNSLLSDELSAVNAPRIHMYSIRPFPINNICAHVCNCKSTGICYQMDQI